MNEEYKTSEAQRKAVRKWTEEHKERKKELDRLHHIRRRERIKKEHQELMKLQNNWNELKKFIEEEIYKIEPKGTGINYNCEYDSEEDYINAMKERSRLITLKQVLINLQELEGNNE